MTVKISINAIVASWDGVPAEQLPELYREVVIGAWHTGWLIGSREQLEAIAHSLESLADAWLYDGNPENRREALIMKRAANKIHKYLDRTLNER